MGSSDLRRQLTAVAPALSTWPSAVRRGGVMAALLVAGVATGNHEAGIAATTGALNIALLDAAVPRAVLARALWLCLFTTTAVGYLAVLIGDSWWLVPFLGLLAFLQGSLSGATLAVANATIANMITAILFGIVPGSFQQAAKSAAWLFVGALVEIVVALIAWHWERQGLLRRQIGVCLRMRARTPVDAERLAEWTGAARATMATAELTAGERRAFGGLVAAVRAPDGPVDRQDLANAARRVRRLPGTGVGGRFSDLVAALDQAPAGVEHRSGGSLRQQATGLRGLLQPGTPSFQSGVRLAVLMVVGTIVVEAFDVPQGHWALLVFALAVRADYSGTIVTLVARAIGVVSGVLALTIIVELTHGSTTVLLVVAVAAGVLTCRWLLGNATMFFLWLTIFVSVLVDASDPTSEFGPQRVAATLLGVGIGLFFSLLWPGWRRAGGQPLHGRGDA